MKKISGLIIVCLLITASLMSVNVALAMYQTCQAQPSSDTSACGSTCSGSNCKNITYAPACGTCVMDESIFASCTSTNFTSQKTVQTTGCVPVVSGYIPDACECGTAGGSTPPTTVACGCVP
jgi:hypothetical protein